MNFLKKKFFWLYLQAFSYPKPCPFNWKEYVDLHNYPNRMSIVPVECLISKNDGICFFQPHRGTAPSCCQKAQVGIDCSKFFPEHSWIDCFLRNFYGICWPGAHWAACVPWLKQNLQKGDDLGSGQVEGSLEKYSTEKCKA